MGTYRMSNGIARAPEESVYEICIPDRGPKKKILPAFFLISLTTWFANRENMDPGGETVHNSDSSQRETFKEEI